ncbi:MAG TPA: VWA domain-containing protein [Bryobacteraceae bacterium]|nr:VWA domain-containing protein [Bryobacteraceae bacterium]
MLSALKQAGFPGVCARACFTVFLVLSPPVFGQSGQTQTAGNKSELSSHDAPATFRARVNLVMVPVVVRDRHGHALGTLKQEDFQLFDKGKAQIISKFSVEKAGAKVVSSAIQVPPPAEDGDRAKPVENTAAAIPTRFVAYLFDDVHLGFPDLAQARTAAMHYLTASFQPTDRAAIYTTSGQGMLDFTDDLAKIREALDRVQPHSKAIPAGSDCPDMTYYMADLIQNKNDPDALKAAEQDAILCAGIIVPTGAGGGGMAALQQAEPLVRGAAARALNLGESDTQLALSVLKNVIRRMAAVPGQRSIVLVSPGFYVPLDYRSDEGDLLEQAIRANVIINSLDARGVYVTIPGGDISERTQSTSMLIQRDQYRRESDLMASGTLAELADGTGGTLFNNNNDLEQGFVRVAQAPEFIYLLGFSPQNLKLDGSYHALKVTLKSLKDATSQARRGYYAPRHEIDPAEQAKEEIREAVFSREEMLDIPLDVETQFFKPSDITATLAVLAKVDIRKLPFRKADGRNNDDLTVVSSVFDRNGNLIKAIQKILEMRLRDETLEKRAAGGITLRSNFDLTPGSYVVRVVVRDAEGQMMAARNGVVEIP